MFCNEARRSLDVAKALRGELRKKNIPVAGNCRNADADRFTDCDEQRGAQRNETLRRSFELRSGGGRRTLNDFFFAEEKMDQGKGFHPGLRVVEGALFFFFSKFTWKNPKISSCEFRDVFFFGFG